MYYVRSDPDERSGESTTYYDHWLDKNGDGIISPEQNEFQRPILIEGFYGQPGNIQIENQLGAQLRLLLNLGKRYEHPTELRYQATISVKQLWSDPWGNDTPLLRQVRPDAPNIDTRTFMNPRDYPILNGSFLAEGEGGFVTLRIPNEAWFNLPVGQYELKVSLALFDGHWQRLHPDQIKVSLSPIYVSAGRPRMPNQLYETVVFTGSYMGMGATEEPGTARKIEDQFIDYLMPYYARCTVYKVARQSPPLKFQLQQNGREEVRTATALLRYGTGNSQAWVDFYLAVLAAQGLNIKEGFKILRIQHQLNGNIPPGSGMLFK
ncbi:MAG: hypothetical protein QXI19_08495 [Candidatus Caldarchaeum sp.]